MTVFDGQFDILGIQISATNDNQVFQTSSDEKFSLIEKAEITGAHERPFPGGRKMSLKDFLRYVGSLPITLSHAGACYPDFAYLVRRTWFAGHGINNNYPLLLGA